jgi:hypothetical protein
MDVACTSGPDGSLGDLPPPQPESDTAMLPTPIATARLIDIFVILDPDCRVGSLLPLISAGQRTT